MTIQLSKFESQRAQLADSLNAVADSMRSCAHIAETFAKIVKDSSFSDEALELINGTLEDHAKGKRKAPLPLEEDGSKKRKRKTKTKDPNAPKRPASSYIIFQNTVRAELKKEFPDISNTELLGMIAEKWKNMPDKDKEIYNQLNKTAKDSYNVQMAAYENRSPEEVEAANAATAAAESLKKKKSRGPKAAPASPVRARPPPSAEEISPNTESSSEEESEEEEEPPAANATASESESSEEEEEKPVPVTKKRRGDSVKPSSKSKKSSKA